MPRIHCACQITEAILKSVAAAEEGSTPLRAVIVTDEAQAISDALSSAARHESSSPRSVWDGVPVVFSQQFDAGPGLAATHGTSFLPLHKAEREHPVVRRFRLAGAVVIGESTAAFSVPSIEICCVQRHNLWLSLQA